MPANQMLSYLPAVYGEDPFLGVFLEPFERILLGPGGKQPALAEIIGNISVYFDPYGAPSEFLDWLSGWVALNLRADLDEPTRRKFIANAVKLYRMRGTKEGLSRFLQIYTGLLPSISEFTGSDFQIGVHSTVGRDTILGGGGPHYFRVLISISESDPHSVKYQHIDRIARAIIDAEKPAHTTYELIVQTPAMEIGVHSTVGVDTVLGIKV